MSSIIQRVVMTALLGYFAKRFTVCSIGVVEHSMWMGILSKPSHLCIIEMAHKCLDNGDPT